MLGARILTAGGASGARKAPPLSLRGLTAAILDPDSLLSRTVLLLQTALFFVGLAATMLMTDCLFAPALFLLVVLLGHALYRRAVLSVFACRLSVHVLMFIVLLGALILGNLREAATVALVVSGSEWLIGFVNAAVEVALQRNLTGNATHATRLSESGKMEDIRIEELKPGDIVLLRSGEAVPVDGKVRKSDSLSVDEASVTGEALPQEKVVGASLLSGTVVVSGSGELTCTASAGESFQGKMQQAVEEARNSRSKTEELVDRLAAAYTPLVCAGALVLAIVSGDPVRGLAALAGACPCALVAAAPIVQACVFVRLLGDLQVLVKGAQALETLSQMRALGVDKTGTLTEGQFEVVDTAILPYAGGRGKQELFRLLAALESRDPHPLASSIVKAHIGCAAEFAAGSGLGALPRVTNFTRVESKGVWGIVDGIVVGAGSAKFLEAMCVDLPKEAAAARKAWEKDAEAFTTVYMTIDEDVVMVLRMEDSIRPDAASAVKALRDSGVEVVLLTGDSRLPAAAVARRVGLTDFAASLAPAQKESWILSQQAGDTGLGALKDGANLCDTGLEAGLGAQLLETGARKSKRGAKVVGMLGDGLNDSPALAAANVGIAVSCGLQLTVDAADVVVNKGRKVLMRFAEAVEVSRRGRRLLVQNLCLAMASKLAALGLAAGGHLTLSAGVLADALSLLLVLLNGLRPLSWRLSSADA
mmetsp:Transcript_63573/g.196881  ORF Transcript_63573/g.196881 Transcript_63573/m.196881 type:complete len:705 (+) Transcript_63573:419-2533(+)